MKNDKEVFFLNPHRHCVSAFPMLYFEAGCKDMQFVFSSKFSFEYFEEFFLQSLNELSLF